MWLVIDGYNLIAALNGEPLALLDLEAERESLLSLLAEYRGLSQHRLTVIFDGGQACGNPRRQRYQGVEVVYSPLGRLADQVLVEFAHRHGSGITVVTSDREVASQSEGFGAVTLASDLFWSRLLSSLAAGGDGVEDEDEGRNAGRHLTRKKGNPRKLSRRERQRRKRLERL
jgi:predicted RNA-binding protein with PIN domain